MSRQKPCYIIVRHGQSLTNVNRNLHKRVSDPAVWLTELGHKQAQMAGEKIAEFVADHKVKNIRVMRSTYRRAMQTSEHIIKSLKDRWGNVLKIDAKNLDRLRELEFGYAGADDLPPYTKEYSNLLRYQNFKYFATRYGGESPAGMEPRVRLSLDAMHRDFRENDITHFVVVCHGLTQRVLVKAIMDYGNDWYENEPNPGNCSIRIIDNGNDKGYIFPKVNGQWEPYWKELPEDMNKLNPDDLFFSPPQMRDLITLQHVYPNIMESVGKMIEENPTITATEILRIVSEKKFQKALESA